MYRNLCEGEFPEIKSSISIISSDDIGLLSAIYIFELFLKIKIYNSRCNGSENDNNEQKKDGT
jgi:hypothetical protein